MDAIVYNTHITDAEWEVMRVVWANDRVTLYVIIIRIYIIFINKSYLNF